MKLVYYAKHALTLEITYTDVRTHLCLFYQHITVEYRLFNWLCGPSLGELIGSTCSKRGSSGIAQGFQGAKLKNKQLLQWISPLRFRK